MGGIDFTNKTRGYQLSAFGIGRDDKYGWSEAFWHGSSGGGAKVRSI